jgi:Dermatopontin
MVNKSKHADLVDAIEFLATIQLKESATAYQQQDYLRLHSIRNSFGEKLASTCYEQTAMHSVACESRNSYEDRELAFTCFKQNMKYNVTWEMSSEGRRQVGQWFYRSKC